MVKTVYWYEYRAKKNDKKWFWNRFFQVTEQFNLWKDYVKCEKM